MSRLLRYCPKPLLLPQLSHTFGAAMSWSCLGLFMAEALFRGGVLGLISPNYPSRVCLQSSRNPHQASPITAAGGDD